MAMHPVASETAAVDLSLSERATLAGHGSAVSKVDIPQYGLRAILAVWAAATLPMGMLAWLVAHAVADRLSGEGNVPMAKALLALLTAGLFWQFVLVLVLGRARAGDAPVAGARGRALAAVAAQPPQRPVRRPGLADPDPAGGRVRGGSAHPRPSALGESRLRLRLGRGTELPERQLGLVRRHRGDAPLQHRPREELLFRGFLLPRMSGALGRGDWAANGVLFAAYHVHVPWVMPAALLDAFILAYPTMRYRSAWIGIAVHSSQSVFFGAIVLAVVFR
jgi:uncharacterized protein